MINKAGRPTPPSLLAQIGSLYHRIYKECDKLFREHDFPLQMDQIPVLMSLYYSGGATQKDIVTSLGRDKASVNRTISFLLKNGLVKVIQDTTDKRKTQVELTPQGESLAEQADVMLAKFDVVLSADLTDNEKGEFNKTMLKLIETVTPCK
ncbi:MarR family transcriptional regulator [Mucilaginibacter sp. CAU 1740]|uniref:MarR family winged helix-turn-helix transcriptional regulator n=1 Tax=Mucilaginibacter sp. CAU 1740 TaxID=3140365 RepID=UPI00325B9130